MFLCFCVQRERESLPAEQAWSDRTLSTVHDRALQEKTPQSVCVLACCASWRCAARTNVSVHAFVPRKLLARPPCAVLCTLSVCLLCVASFRARRERVAACWAGLGQANLQPQVPATPLPRKSHTTHPRHRASTDRHLCWVGHPQIPELLCTVQNNPALLNGRLAWTGLREATAKEKKLGRQPVARKKKTKRELRILIELPADLGTNQKKSHANSIARVG